MAEEIRTDSSEVEPEEGLTRRFLRDWVKPIVLACVIVFPFRSAVADYNEVPTGSMKPTIVEGDRIFVNRLAYGLKVPFTHLHLARWATPKQGEIVVLDSPADGVRLVKRVVAVPGDRVELRNNHLTINGEHAAYEWLPGQQHEGLVDAGGPPAFMRESIEGSTRRILWNPGRLGLPEFGPVTVPPGKYLVFGDNRDASGDSRVFGYVPEDAILGRVSKVLFSLDPRGTLSFRDDRFLADLK